MRLLTNYLLIILIIIPITLTAQTEADKNELYKETAEKIINSALRKREAYSMLEELCSIGSRLSGSENSLKAIHWAEDKMKAMDFDSVWLQPVMVPQWVRGNIEKAVISGGKYAGRKINICALGGSVGTTKEGITAPVIEVENLEELDSINYKVRGKIVYINEPMDEGLINTFDSYGKAVRKRVSGAIYASKYGALAVIIRSITTKHDNVPHAGVMYYHDSIPKIPGTAAGYSDSDFLHRAIKEDPHIKLTIKLSCKTLPDVESYNVIGEIKGTEKPEEVIVVGGHIDSWDKGQGAHDDGAGCTQSMEVLSLLKRLELKNKRTIRCILFINEENGSRGASVYGKYSDTTQEKHIAAIESDAGGFTPRGFTVTSDSSVLAKMQTWLPILQLCGIEYIEKGGSGADINDIRKAKALVGYHPDIQRYFDFHHSDNDVISAINPRELESGAAAITILAYLISQEGL